MGQVVAAGRPAPTPDVSSRTVAAADEPAATTCAAREDGSPPAQPRPYETPPPGPSWPGRPPKDFRIQRTRSPSPPDVPGKLWRPDCEIAVADNEDLVSSRSAPVRTSEVQAPCSSSSVTQLPL